MAADAPRASGTSAFRWAVICAIASLGLYVGAAAAGWPGEPNACLDGGNCYCESVRSGPIAQPANTLSCLGFVIVGLWIGLHADRARPARSGDLFVDDPLLPAIYAAVAVFLGPGAMYFHGGMVEWGGVLDALSMYFFIFFVVAYDLTRWLGRGRTFFLVAYFGPLGIATVWQTVMSGSSIPIFATAVTAAVLLEIALAVHAARAGARPVTDASPAERSRLRVIGGSRRWVVFGATCFGLAASVWLPAHTDGPLCFPDSLLQGHAAWHLLCALTVGAIYLHFREPAEARQGAKVAS